MGYNQADEHFQVLEFANYKSGNSPAADLPWEFHDKIRSGVQPFIAYCAIAVFHSMGILNPFVIAFLFRLIAGFLSWMIICKLIILLLPDFNTERGKKLFVLLNLFLWFIPYLNVRFSSENMATVCFLWALYLLLKPYDSKKQENISFLIIGALAGASFFFRFQMAFAIIGLAAWLLFIKKIKPMQWLWLIFSGLLVSIICVCLDKWLYRTWEFTPYNYYYANIVRHIAAGFGVFPWWYYFTTFFLLGIPPISLALMLFMFAGLYKKPLHVFSFILLPFLIGHFIVGHKEMRFLIPVTFGFIYLASTGIDYCIATFKNRKIYAYGFKFMVALNLFMMLYRTLNPAQEAIPCLKFVYERFGQKPTTILCMQEPLFSLYGLNLNFYKPATLKQFVFKNEDELNKYITASNEDSVLVFQRNFFLAPKLSDSYTYKRIYMLYPEFIAKYDFNQWQERAHIWSIYALYKKHN